MESFFDVMQNVITDNALWEEACELGWQSHAQGQQHARAGHHHRRVRAPQWTPPCSRTTDISTTSPACACCIRSTNLR